MIPRLSNVILLSLFGALNAFVPSPTARISFISLSSSTKNEEVTQSVNPRLEGLSFMLDDGTRKSHSVAENTAFVTGFFKGLSTKESYRSLLTSLWFVYGAMERAFDECQLEEVQRLDDKELRRIEGLRADMDYFHGTNGYENISRSFFTRKYVERIEKVAKEKPYLLIAHQYTRYLGDLFGGQMMSGMATRSLNLPEGKGVEFYRFEGIKNTKDYINDWYSRLNSLDLSSDQKKEIVDEANLVFELNIGIFQELEGSALAAMWSVAWVTFKEKLGLS